jgi:23S rRNA (guanosine2251-2'-O)-methyltransferase
VIRVAECAGAAGVVIGERRAAQVTPVVCKASAGAVEHMRVARARNLADYLAHAKQQGAWVYGTSAADAVPYDQPDYRGKVVVVFGSEGRGLRPRVRAACDELIALPLLGHIDSLNVSAAASAVLYGILQFRKFLVDSAP